VVIVPVAVHEQVFGWVSAVLTAVAWEGGTPSVAVQWRSDDTTNVPPLPAVLAVVGDEPDEDFPFDTEHAGVLYRVEIGFLDRADVMEQGKRPRYLRWREQGRRALRYQTPADVAGAWQVTLRNLRVADWLAGQYQLWRSGFVAEVRVAESYDLR
jgi:hypothetical protein